MNETERILIMSDAFRPNPFRLAFGLMRLPKNPDGSIDIPQVCEMTDRFIAAGGTYFDTAYVYDGGDSEKAFRAAVADRYPGKPIPWPRSCTPPSGRRTRRAPRRNLP